MYPINTYNTSTFANNFAKFGPSYVYTYNIEVNSTAINYVPTEYDYGSSQKKTSNQLLAFTIERYADYIASIGGFIAGYPTGFAIGVLTKTNPLATASAFGTAGAYLFPIVIKEIVT